MHSIKSHNRHDDSFDRQFRSKKKLKRGSALGAGPARVSKIGLAAQRICSFKPYFLIHHHQPKDLENPTSITFFHFYSLHLKHNKRKNL